MKTASYLYEEERFQEYTMDIKNHREIAAMAEKLLQIVNEDTGTLFYFIPCQHGQNTAFYAAAVAQSVSEKAVPDPVLIIDTCGEMPNAGTALGLNSTQRTNTPDTKTLTLNSLILRTKYKNLFCITNTILFQGSKCSSLVNLMSVLKKQFRMMWTLKKRKDFYKNK